MKSNINTISNIYIRTGEAVETDTKFLKQVRGYKALSYIAPIGTTNFNKLTPIQKAEIEQLAPCTSSNNLLCEQTFGAVKDGEDIVWSCRCENIDCSHYSKCISEKYSKKISRIIPNILNSNDTENDDLNANVKKLDFEYLGLTENIVEDESFNQDKIIDIGEVFKEQIEPQDEVLVKEFEESNCEYIPITDQDIITRSLVDEKILVNAGPGTGKTYIVIERLKYILSNKLIKNIEKIVIICYTNSSKKMIQNKIDEKVKDGVFDVSAKNINVTTIDSFATAHLSDIGKSEYKKMNYDQRIEQFNDYYSKDKIDFEYLIIDEIQDFVNHRALMVATILSSINCGCLLLGDKCQAIYDYSSNDTDFSVTSVDFYNLLYKILPQETKKYELTKNVRQLNKLLTLSTNVRNALLTDDFKEIQSVIAREIKPYEIESKTVAKFEPFRSNVNKVAILCRSNGEAEYVSCALHKKLMPHNLITATQSKPAYVEWISTILWDYCEDIITKENFIRRYIDRVRDNMVKANHYFNVLLNFSNPNSKNKFIIKDELSQAMLTKKEIPSELLQINENLITVTTIHKAKGKEFDKVYLIKTPIDNIEEARVLYVATTRAKSELEIIDIKGKPAFNNKYKRTIVERKSYNFTHAIHIAMHDDIDNSSVITGDFYSVTSLQKYISENVKVNDKLDLILKDNKYLIYHVKNTLKNRTEDMILGTLSSQSMVEIKKYTKNYPPRIHDVFVSHIVTVPHNNLNNNIPNQFKESRFSLGLKINGFVKIDWKYGE